MYIMCHIFHLDVRYVSHFPSRCTLCVTFSISVYVMCHIFHLDVRYVLQCLFSTFIALQALYKFSLIIINNNNDNNNNGGDLYCSIYKGEQTTLYKCKIIRSIKK